MVEKIKELFEKMGCPVVAILQTPQAEKSVDNGYGIDFGLSEFAVIYDKVENLHLNGKMRYLFEQENNIDIMSFESSGCSPSVDALIQELYDMDGYEIKWQRK